MSLGADGSGAKETSNANALDVNSSSLGAGANATLQQQQLPAYLTSALQSLVSGNNKLASVDSSTASAIAAAMSGLNQNGAGVQIGAGAAAGISPTLMAALRNSGLVVPAANTASVTIQPQVLSLLSAVAGGGGAAVPGLSFPPVATSFPSNLHGQLQQLLNQQAETAKLSSTSPPPPVVSHASSSLSIGSPAPVGGMQDWSLKQLEQHVALLQRLQQPVPQTVALLLAEAQRKEKKKTAKRAANRKSASTSRARKKALVEEITQTNARLKRQAMILALLPDLVIATTLEGVMSFCSAQVERILGHNADDLLGLHVDRVLMPSSRETLRKLFSRIASSSKASSSCPQQKARRGVKRRHEKQSGDNATPSNGDNNQGNAAGDGNSGNSGTISGAAVISEQSFPPAVVEVDSKQRRNAVDNAEKSRLASNENSDNSTSNNSGSNNTSNESKQQVSSLSNATGMSPTDSPDEDEGAAQGESKKTPKRVKSSKKKQRAGNGDDSSSLSSEAKKAGDNLDRNVRWHNQRMLDGSQKSQSDYGPKDDVTGDPVTANNASARLSSLNYIPSPAAKKNDENDQSLSDDSLLAGVEEKKKVENQSDDSGYRESNDSREEEESSSGSDASNAKKKRRQRLAPTVKLCLVRRDLSTVWCEVTSSLRQRTEDIEPLEIQLIGDSVDTDPPAKKEPPVQEYLLCLRPMRDGDKTAEESMRIFSTCSSLTEKNGPPDVSSSGNDSYNASNLLKVDSEKTSEDSTGSSDNKDKSKQPPKKRPLESSQDFSNEGAAKVQKLQVGGGGDVDGAEENHAIESLMLMNRN